MIKIKVEEGKNNLPLFKLSLNEEALVKYKFLKRPLMEGKKIKGDYNYIIPVRYLLPIVNNIENKDKIIDICTIDFFEFWDEFEEIEFISTIATAKFMKLWRRENCPHIFKIHINNKTLLVEKEIAFKRVNVKINKNNS
ncbi:hypothetical protein [Clostridium sp.]|uniref:hypothetical protein n=1 Tax=Clostridium sp. TaxID=1506 RepID=UPI0026155DFE|nr:hypothetical protein [Clostridium sp.]